MVCIFSQKEAYFLMSALNFFGNQYELRSKLISVFQETAINQKNMLYWIWKFLNNFVLFVSIQNSEPNIFNEFMIKLKDELRKTGRTDFWHDIVHGK